MSLLIGTVRDRRKTLYYVLKESYWDRVQVVVPEGHEPKTVGLQKQRYIGCLGREKCITRSKALAICKKKGIAIERLERVKGLEIKDNGE